MWDVSLMSVLGRHSASLVYIGIRLHIDTCTPHQPLTRTPTQNKRRCQLNWGFSWCTHPSTLGHAFAVAAAAPSWSWRPQFCISYAFPPLFYCKECFQMCSGRVESALLLLFIDTGGRFDLLCKTTVGTFRWSHKCPSYRDVSVYLNPITWW